MAKSGTTRAAKPLNWAGTEEELHELIVPRARLLLRFFSVEEIVMSSKEAKPQPEKKPVRSRKLKGGSSTSLETSIIENYVTIENELSRAIPDLRAIGLAYLRLLPYAGPITREASSGD